MEDMETHGVEPNERTFSAAIAAFSKGGQWQRALDTLQQLKEKKLQVGTAAYNAAMTACLHGRQPQRVADLLAEMQTERSCVPDVATYATAIAAAGACG
jgi:pentatricopeptide repeat domain-containing protein 1